ERRSRSLRGPRLSFPPLRPLARRARGRRLDRRQTSSSLAATRRRLRIAAAIPRAMPSSASNGVVPAH
ncbi:MAG: hypothetical protein V3U07_03090, partial [Nitrospirales bacterium]